MSQTPADPQTESLTAGRLADFRQRHSAQQRRFYARSPKRIGNVIAQVFQRRGYAQVRSAGQRDQAWQQAVTEHGGQAWHASTRVGSFRRGTLEVLVANSLLMQELTFCKEQLLATLQEALPDEGVKQIKFRVGDVS